MGYSKAYQTVVAGRVREDEAIAYFGDNRFTTPAGNFDMVRTGGSTAQPVITKNWLGIEYVGKNTNRDVPLLEAYDAGSNQVGKA